MISKLFPFVFFIVFASTASSQNNSNPGKLTDEKIQFFIKTLPNLAPKLKEEGINVSQAYYIWPKDAGLHAKGKVLLKEYGYDALRLEALKTFCKAWFCINYDALLPERRKILYTFEEQLTENPYLTDNQKRINIRITNKDLGHNQEQLRQDIGKENLRLIRVYRNKIKEMWLEIEK